MLMSVPTRTFRSVMLVRISPGKFGSSKRSVCTTRSPGTSSRNSPPNEWLCPVERLRERHAPLAAHLRVELVHLAGEAVRRQPLCYRFGVSKGAIHPLGRRAQHAV